MFWPSHLHCSERRRSRCFGLLVGAGLILPFAGCGDARQKGATVSARPGAAEVEPTTDQPSDRLASSDQSVAQPAQHDGVVALETIRLDDPDPRIDPGDDGWQSEVFGEAADRQLNLIGQLLADGQPIPAHRIAQLVHEDFQCGRLRPLRLTIVFEDPSLVVQRGAQADRARLERVGEYRGAQGLGRALADLLTPFGGTTEVRCKFKIFSVDMSSAGPSTQAHFQLSGRAPAGMVQQSAIWRCQWAQQTSAQAPKLKSISISDYQRSTGLRSNGSLFSDCTEAVLGHNASYRAQLAYGFDHWLKRLELVNGILATSYHGLAVGDVNGDGLDDIYVCQPGGLMGGLPNRLYVQQPDGRAHDVSEAAGVDWLIETPSALLVDLDNDGDQDLVAATIAGLIIAANDGQGTFHPKAAKLIPEAPPISVGAADFDDDGDLDIYACCYSRRSSSPLAGRPIPYHDANNGGRNVLFRNDRDWRLTNVTKQVGLDQNNRRFSLAAAWEDFDNDGDQDLYVANDFGRNNLYRNDGGRFTDIAAQAGVEDISAGMSVSWGDYNNDGWMDLYISNMWSSAGNRIAYQRRFLRSGADPGTLADFQRHARGNSLFTNLGKSNVTGFQDGSTSAGVTMGRWAWSSLLVDINSDGLEDVMVANGYITQEDTGDL